jgi:hypothetical protein
VRYKKGADAVPSLRGIGSVLEAAQRSEGQVIQRYGEAFKDTVTVYAACPAESGIRGLSGQVWRNLVVRHCKTAWHWADVWILLDDIFPVRFFDRRVWDRKFWDGGLWDRRVRNRRFWDRIFRDRRFCDRKFRDQRFWDRKFQDRIFWDGLNPSGYVHREHFSIFLVNISTGSQVACSSLDGDVGLGAGVLIFTHGLFLFSMGPRSKTPQLRHSRNEAARNQEPVDRGFAAEMKKVGMGRALGIFSRGGGGGITWERGENL